MQLFIINATSIILHIALVAPPHHLLCIGTFTSPVELLVLDHIIVGRNCIAPGSLKLLATATSDWSDHLAASVAILRFKALQRLLLDLNELIL
jgi:endonuclease/exonuclease/phosphatase family metal-dependent hydrolase